MSPRSSRNGGAVFEYHPVDVNPPSTPSQAACYLFPGAENNTGDAPLVCSELEGGTVGPTSYEFECIDGGGVCLAGCGYPGGGVIPCVREEEIIFDTGYAYEPPDVCVLGTCVFTNSFTTIVKMIMDENN